MPYTDCKKKHYKCYDKNCCISSLKCSYCRTNLELKRQVEQWIEIIGVIQEAHAGLRKALGLSTKMYKRFHLNEVFEDQGKLQELEVDMPIDFIHWDMDMRESLGFNDEYDRHGNPVLWGRNK